MTRTHGGMVFLISAITFAACFGRVGRVGAFLVPLVGFGACDGEAGINFYHVRLERWVGEDSFERFKVFLGVGTRHSRHHVVNNFETSVFGDSCCFNHVCDGVGSAD